MRTFIIINIGYQTHFPMSIGITAGVWHGPG
jgi:hypothetical protein